MWLLNTSQCFPPLPFTPLPLSDKPEFGGGLLICFGFARSLLICQGQSHDLTFYFLPVCYATYGLDCWRNTCNFYPFFIGVVVLSCKTKYSEYLRLQFMEADLLAANWIIERGDFFGFYLL